MIALWMMSAIVFTALCAVTAFAAERALRLMQWQGRLPWLAAAAVGAAWPVLVPMLRLLGHVETRAVVGATRLPAIRIDAGATMIAPPAMHTVSIVATVCWAAASALLLARMASAVITARRLRRESKPTVVDGVPVLLSANVGPAVVGLRKQQIMVTPALLELEESLRRLVLDHEDEHRRARDTWAVFGTALAVVLLPWNAPLWWIARRTRLAMELDCDARVLARGADAGRYGRLLMLIAQRSSPMSLAPMLVASPSQLERRITAMQRLGLARRPLHVGMFIALATVAGAAACASRITDQASPAPTASRSTTPTSAEKPYFEFQVERQVKQIAGIGNLRYPDVLRKAGVEGEVLAQFVVNEEGLYEPGTFQVLKSTHELFTESVKNALPMMRFTPAEVGGRKVKQLVQQPFTFSLKNGDGTPVAASGATTIPNPRH